MATFSYVGRTSAGKTVKGTMDAENTNEVAVSLRRQNVYPIKISRADATGREINIRKKSKKVNQKDLSLFCGQFSTIISSGISIIECLDILRKQSENQRICEVSDAMFEDVQKGITLSKSMARFPKVFPEILVNMVHSGEISGQLDIIMERMSTHFEKEHKINMKLRNAMFYPVILISISVIVTAILLVFVLPNFVAMFQGFGVDLPGPTRFVLGIGDFFRNYWWAVIGAVVGGMYGFRRFINTAEGRLRADDIKLKLPIVGKVNQKIATSRFARSLATMIGSGISIIESMEIVSQVIGNKRVQSGIDESLERIKKGEGVSGPLSKLELFPPMLLSMIRIGEETGSLESMLETSATFYDEEVDNAIDNMIQLINPVILLFMALVVGTIVVAIVMPMFEMYQHLEI